MGFNLGCGRLSVAVQSWPKELVMGCEEREREREREKVQAPNPPIFPPITTQRFRKFSQPMTNSFGLPCMFNGKAGRPLKGSGKWEVKINPFQCNLSLSRYENMHTPATPLRVLTRDECERLTHSLQVETRREGGREGEGLPQFCDPSGPG